MGHFDDVLEWSTHIAAAVGAGAVREAWEVAWDWGRGGIYVYIYMFIVNRNKCFIYNVSYVIS